jgi:hypothetical protein
MIKGLLGSGTWSAHPQNVSKLPAGAIVLAAAAAAAALFAAPASSQAALVYGLSNNNNLFSFDSATPSSILSGVFISGLQQNEQMLNIDFRPANGQLLGLGSSNRLYSINPASGVATAIGTGFSPPLNGNAFGYDVNPVVDKVRVTSDADSNFRLDPNTGGLTATDTNLAYAAADPNFGQDPSVVGAAYTNPAAGLTTLYGIDSRLNTLVTIGSIGGAISPNTGQLFTVGALGVDAANLVGFDIGPNGTAYAALQPTNSGVSNFYTINLVTGAATNQGTIIGGTLVRDIAVVIPEPSSILGLAGVTMLLVSSRRRSR